ncbi:hypothetical protein GQ53DRAFT_771595 [Thozetella sp. PMI_491]|nr:hypothetical protein GQ53DRAFT_771595 [Thozetella sp. PMI_491]
MAGENTSDNHIDLLAVLLGHLDSFDYHPSQGSGANAIPVATSDKRTDQPQTIMEPSTGDQRDRRTGKRPLENPVDRPDRKVIIKTEKSVNLALHKDGTPASIRAKLPVKQSFFDTAVSGLPEGSQPQSNQPRGPLPGLANSPLASSRRYISPAARLLTGPQPAAGTPQANFKNLVLRPRVNSLSLGPLSAISEPASNRPLPEGNPIGPGGASSGPLPHVSTMPNGHTDKRNYRLGDCRGAVQRLSFECQRRGFNPQWSDRECPTAELAKKDSAEKALAFLANMPQDKVFWQHRASDTANRGRNSVARQRSPQPEETGLVRMKQEYREREDVRGRAREPDRERARQRDHDRGQVRSNGNIVTRGSERRSLLEKIGAMMSDDTTIKKYIGERPDVSGAFFEGLALGTRMASQCASSYSGIDSSAIPYREGAGSRWERDHWDGRDRADYPSPDRYDFSPKQRRSLSRQPKRSYEYSTQGSSFEHMVFEEFGAGRAARFATPMYQ